MSAAPTPSRRGLLPLLPSYGLNRQSAARSSSPPPLPSAKLLSPSLAGALTVPAPSSQPGSPTLAPSHGVSSTPSTSRVLLRQLGGADSLRHFLDSPPTTPSLLAGGGAATAAAAITAATPSAPLPPGVLIPQSSLQLQLVTAAKVEAQQQLAARVRGALHKLQRVQEMLAANLLNIRWERACKVVAAWRGSRLALASQPPEEPTAAAAVAAAAAAAATCRPLPPLPLTPSPNFGPPIPEGLSLHAWRMANPYALVADASSRPDLDLFYLQGLQGVCLRGAQQPALSDATLAHLQGTQALDLTGADCSTVSEGGLLQLQGLRFLDLSLQPQPQHVISSGSGSGSACPPPPCLTPHAVTALFAAGLCTLRRHADHAALLTWRGAVYTAVCTGSVLQLHLDGLEQQGSELEACLAPHRPPPVAFELSGAAVGQAQEQQGVPCIHVYLPGSSSSSNYGLAEGEPLAFAASSGWAHEWWLERLSMASVQPLWWPGGLGMGPGGSAAPQAIPYEQWLGQQGSSSSSSGSGGPPDPFICHPPLLAVPPWQCHSLLLQRLRASTILTPPTTTTTTTTTQQHPYPALLADSKCALLHDLASFVGHPQAMAVLQGRLPYQAFCSLLQDVLAVVLAHLCPQQPPPAELASLWPQRALLHSLLLHLLQQAPPHSWLLGQLAPTLFSSALLQPLLQLLDSAVPSERQQVGEVARCLLRAVEGRVLSQCHPVLVQALVAGAGRDAQLAGEVALALLGSWSGGEANWQLRALGALEGVLVHVMEGDLLLPAMADQLSYCLHTCLSSPSPSVLLAALQLLGRPDTGATQKLTRALLELPATRQHTLPRLVPQLLAASHARRTDGSGGSSETTRALSCAVLAQWQAIDPVGVKAYWGEEERAAAAAAAQAQRAEEERVAREAAAAAAAVAAAEAAAAAAAAEAAAQAAAAEAAAAAALAQAQQAAAAALYSSAPAVSTLLRRSTIHSLVCAASGVMFAVVSASGASASTTPPQPQQHLVRYKLKDSQAGASPSIVSAASVVSSSSETGGGGGGGGSGFSSSASVLSEGREAAVVKKVLKEVPGGSQLALSTCSTRLYRVSPSQQHPAQGATGSIAWHDTASPAHEHRLVAGAPFAAEVQAVAVDASGLLAVLSGLQVHLYRVSGGSGSGGSSSGGTPLLPPAVTASAVATLRLEHPIDTTHLRPTSLLHLQPNTLAVSYVNFAVDAASGQGRREVGIAAVGTSGSAAGLMEPLMPVTPFPYTIASMCRAPDGSIFFSHRDSTGREEGELVGHGVSRLVFGGEGGWEGVPVPVAGDLGVFYSDAAVSVVRRGVDVEGGVGGGEELEEEEEEEEEEEGGEAGSTHDRDGLGSQAQFFYPGLLVADPLRRSLWVVDGDHAGCANQRGSARALRRLEFSEGEAAEAAAAAAASNSEGSVL